MNQNPQYPYGSNPNDPRVDPYNAYRPHLPGSGSNPGFYPPSDPAEEATLPSSGSNPNFNPYTSTPTPPPPPPKRSRLFSARVLFLIGLALLIILAGISFGIIIPYQNAQTSNAHATATAQARFNATAQANTLATAVSGTATANANATATAVASQYPFSNQLVLDDPMYDNSHGNKWAEGPDSDGNCQFTQGALHVSAEVGFFQYCLAVATNFSNFTYEVKMTIIKGSDGGIVFRGNQNTSAFYYLVIGPDGRYFFFYYDGSHFHALDAGTITHEISGFYTGLNQATLLGVVARGNKLDLYANGQRFASETDNSSSQGEIGVVASAFSQPTEVAFSDAKVWML